MCQDERHTLANSISHTRYSESSELPEDHAVFPPRWGAHHLEVGEGVSHDS